MSSASNDRKTRSGSCAPENQLAPQQLYKHASPNENPFRPSRSGEHRCRPDQRFPGDLPGLLPQLSCLRGCLPGRRTGHAPETPALHHDRSGLCRNHADDGHPPFAANQAGQERAEGRRPRLRNRLPELRRRVRKTRRHTCPLRALRKNLPRVRKEMPGTGPTPLTGKPSEKCGRGRIGRRCLFADEMRRSTTVHGWLGSISTSAIRHQCARRFIT